MIFRPGRDGAHISGTARNDGPAPGNAIDQIRAASRASAAEPIFLNEPDG